MKLIKLGALLLLIFFLFSHFVGNYLPDIRSLRTQNPKHTAYMGDESRRVTQHWVPLNRISRNLRQAVLVSEDGAFYQHHGIDIHEFIESIKKNVEKRSFNRGFSTISMQLARNLYLKPNKSIARKLKELMIAFAIEKELSKDRIFELYLNVIEWGRGIYGAEAAARHYFGKSASQLTAWEAGFLAAIIPSPQRFGKIPPGPYISNRVDVILNRVHARWGEKPHT